MLGELDTEAARLDEAGGHLGASLALADACEAPYERALTLLAFADLHASKRDRDAATSALETARSILDALGAKPAPARADTLAARIAALTSTQPVYPAGLSTREVEVLRLLAEGQANQEIADALFLSVHTVRVHVRGILTKTGADNRTAAAAFARREGLA